MWFENPSPTLHLWFLGFLLLLGAFIWLTCNEHDSTTDREEKHIDDIKDNKREK